MQLKAPMDTAGSRCTAPSFERPGLEFEFMKNARHKFHQIFTDWSRCKERRAGLNVEAPIEKWRDDKRETSLPLYASLTLSEWPTLSPP